MKAPLAVLLAAAVLAGAAAYASGGWPLLHEGLSTAAATGLRVSPLLVAAFIVVGQLHGLLSAESISRWLNRSAGIRGIVLSALAGGLFPGGPYIYYPFLYSLKGKGIPFYLMFSFIAGKHVYDYSRFPLEAGLITPGLAVLRTLITLPVPLIMGIIAYRLYPESLWGSAGSEMPGEEEE